MESSNIHSIGNSPENLNQSLSQKNNSSENSNKSFAGLEKLKSFFYLFLVLMLSWLLLTTSFNYQELLTGFAITIVLSFTLNWYYLKLGFPPFTIKRIFYFIIYIIVLFVEIVKANFDVAYRVIHPRLPIKPGIVVITTRLKQDLAKLMLANSITLTPGTFTLDIIDDALLIHWINVKSTDREEATRRIGRKFERYLIKIFGE